MSTKKCVSRYSKRVENLRPSCVREMMKQTSGNNMISFAAGLPNPALFPVAEISQAVSAVLVSDAAGALQYASTEGYPLLRDYIAKEILGKEGIDASAEDIIITNGSQQALDLVGKVFIDKGTNVLMEQPTYMAAIQAFDLYQPTYHSVPLLHNGIDVELLEEKLKKYPINLMYGVTNFQNPTGITYSLKTREKVAELLAEYGTVFVEDNPYSELRYDGKNLPLISKLRPENSIIIGTFSKVFSPGIRMGWIKADRDIIRNIVLAKQASDLCSNYFSQYILYNYLINNDLNSHIESLKKDYKKRRDSMLGLLENYMPKGTSWTKPKGGMFVWVTLPEDVSATELLARTIKSGVVFAPGDSFYACNPKLNTMRLNFTHSSFENMEKGIKILAENIK